MEFNAILATVVFAGIYALIIWDKIDRAVIALLGACGLVFLGVLSQEDAILGVDFNTIGLLIGMMVIVAVCQKTGMFQYLAVKSAKLAKGEPARILVYLSVITAVLSAFLDNVTTVLLIAPIALLIVNELNLSPYPYLYSVVMASNIGGTATLIGDPPNILIGSSQGFSFMDFLVHVAPVIVIIMAAHLILIVMIYGRGLKVSAELKQRIMQFRESDTITDPALLKKALLIFALVIVGFVFHGALHIEAATIALSGAALIILVSGEKAHELMEKVEWPVIFFLIGFFIIVQGLVETGITAIMAEKIVELTGGEVSATASYVLWGSGISGAFLGNIPTTVAMIPVIDGMEPHIGGQLAAMPVWWALSLGACLGGNGTIIGAPANVIVAGFAVRSGYPLMTFFRFMLVAFPLTLVNIAISHLYIYMRYL